jgi:hypothetical protein
MAGDDRLECFGDAGDRVHIVQFASGYDGCEQGPVFGADLMTGKERVFLVKQIGRIAFSTDWCRARDAVV